MRRFSRTTFGPVGAALAASLVGIGLARFGYTPLVPALIKAHWLTPTGAAYLGAANLAGYLIGALTGRYVAARWRAAFILRATMVVATFTFFASMIPLGFTWFFIWRLVSGLAGGVLMVLAAPLVLPAIPPHRRGAAAGLIFTGVGLGIAASGIVIPPLLHRGLSAAWLVLGILAALLTLVAWPLWPTKAASASGSQPAKLSAAEPPVAVLRALHLEYGLNAVGLVPHMLFLVDFVARSRGQGIGVGAAVWITFGIGALIGPLLAGHVGDRIGFRPTLRLGFLIQAVAVVLIAAPVGVPAIFVSALIVGAFVPGIVPLVLGRLHELIADADTRHAAWSIATVAFAIGQAAAAYGFSFLFAHTGSYVLSYVAGAIALILALAIDFTIGTTNASAPQEAKLFRVKV